jgi:hypothetical protein
MRIRALTYSASTYTLVLATTLLLGCTKEDSGNSDSSQGGSGRSSSQCGVVVDGSLKNPASLENASAVSIAQVISGNLLILFPDGKPQQRMLVKLHGIDASRDNFKNQRAIKELRERTAGGAFFFKATKDCEVDVNGGRATIGTLVTAGGLNLNEFLLINSLVEADSRDACGGELIGSCYSALAEDATDSVAGQLKCGFLWKPASDKDGNLAVLVDECDVDVYANGEKLSQAGSGNGRCTTTRSGKPGCSYGGRATVKVIDQRSGLPYVFPNGSTEFVLDGCKRVEFPC